jgi:hypothetical protein
MVRLPGSLYVPTFADLPNGESGWTTPWTLVVDEDGGCWIDPTTRLWPAPGGTVTMRVTRVGVNACEVDLSAEHAFLWPRPKKGVYTTGMWPVVKLIQGNRVYF